MNAFSTLYLVLGHVRTRFQLTLTMRNIKKNGKKITKFFINDIQNPSFILLHNILTDLYFSVTKVMSFSKKKEVPLLFH